MSARAWLPLLALTLHAQQPTQPAAEARTQLNLLGQTDTQSGESRRNENVQFNLIDNNALKEINQRLGLTPTIHSSFSPERHYFGAEFGSPPSSSILLSPKPTPKPPSFHAHATFLHLNSITSARSFFQVGPVLPARENIPSFGLTTRLFPRAFLSLDASRQAIRGIVNGNVQVPAPDERTPLATNPIIRNFVSQILNAFPASLPNRTDIDPRMLNTNAPQRVTNDNASLRLDYSLSPSLKAIASYSHTAARVLAFQLIQGQNPNTTTMSHQAGLQLHATLSPRSTAVFAFRFDRTRSLITLDNNAIPLQIFSGVLRAINDNNAVPIDRSQNLFKPALQLAHSTSRHNLKAGFELLRRQMNGRESDAHTNALAFFNNYGNTAITNIRLGLPSTFWIAQGNLHRGYRNWDNWFYLADSFSPAQRLSLSLSLGYRPISRPIEVNSIDRVPYFSDLNNFAPTLGLAFRLPPKLGVLRAAYGLHYGEIFPVTFQQIRFNPPNNNKAVIQDPDLLRVLAGGYDIRSNPPRQSVFYDYPSNLVSPYSQQYNFQWELAPSPTWSWHLAYVGSRSLKLLNHWYLNRAQPIPGIPLTTATVDARRAVQDKGEIRKVMNSSRGWFDAFRTTLSSRAFHNVTLEASYWFSKSIDLGGDYTNTAHDVDSFRYRSQSEFNSAPDLRATSRFHSPHALLLKSDYLLPLPASFRRLGRWRFDSVILAKTGTPFNLATGSDAPGFGNVDGISGDRPNLLDPSILGRAISHPDSARQLLPRSAFAFIRPNEPRGNLGRHVFHRAPIRNWNAGLTALFAAPKDIALTLRFEAINLSNTPQFAEPGLNLADPNFGVITNTLNDGRSFRVSLRLSR